MGARTKRSMLNSRDFDGGVVDDFFAWGEQEDPRVAVFPDGLVEGVARVELGLKHDEGFVRGGVALVGFDGRRGAGYLDGEMGGGVVNFGGDSAVGVADEIDKAVVEELVSHGAWLPEIVLGSGCGLGDAGGEDVVVVVDQGERIGGNFQFRLFAITAGNVEVGMPADAHGAGFGAGVDGRDFQYEGLRS